MTSFVVMPEGVGGNWAKARETRAKLLDRKCNKIMLRVEMDKDKWTMVLNVITQAIRSA